MFQEPIVKDRVRTALEEGITSQSIARAKRDHSRRDSILRRFIRSISRLWNKETKQTSNIQKSFGFRQSEETIK
jgi:hypothetical protein